MGNAFDYEPAGPDSNPSLESKWAAHSAVNPFFEGGQQWRQTLRSTVFIIELQSLAIYQKKKWWRKKLHGDLWKK